MTRARAVAYAADYFDSGAFLADLSRRVAFRTESQAVRAVLLPNLGGSLPNDAFCDELGMSTVWVPHSYPACAQHAPDEHLLAPLAREALRLMAGLFWDLGERA